MNTKKLIFSSLIYNHRGSCVFLAICLSGPWAGLQKNYIANFLKTWWNMGQRRTHSIWLRIHLTKRKHLFFYVLRRSTLCKCTCFSEKNVVCVVGGSDESTCGSGHLAPKLELDSKRNGCSQNKDKSVLWLQDAGTYTSTVRMVSLLRWFCWCCYVTTG